jgi:hypothetical protein
MLHLLGRQGARIEPPTGYVRIAPSATLRRMRTAALCHADFQRFRRLMAFNSLKRAAALMFLGNGLFGRSSRTGTNINALLRLFLQPLQLYTPPS